MAYFEINQYTGGGVDTGSEVVIESDNVVCTTHITGQDVLRLYARETTPVIVNKTAFEAEMAISDSVPLVNAAGATIGTLKINGLAFTALVPGYRRRPNDVAIVSLLGVAPNFLVKLSSLETLLNASGYTTP